MSKWKRFVSNMQSETCTWHISDPKKEQHNEKLPKINQKSTILDDPKSS